MNNFSLLYPKRRGEPATALALCALKEL